MTLFDQDTWSGKMSPEPSALTKAETLRQFSKKPSASLNRKPPLFLSLRKDGPQADASWETDGALRGEFPTLSFGEHPISLFHNGDGESRLWQILEEEPHPKYYLSGKACRGILTRAERRQKEIPALLKATLEMQAERECRNHKPEILLRLRPEHAEAHMGPGQALLYDVRRAG